MYPKIILEHFAKPRNVGVIKTPTSIGEASTPGGGKAVFYFLIKDGTVKEVKYQVAGCPYAIAVCSILSVYAEGKHVKKLLNVSISTVEQIFTVPEDKIKCVKLALTAFLEGLKSYKL